MNRTERLRDDDGLSPLEVPADKLGEGIPSIPEHRLLRRIAAGAYGEVWLGLNAVGTPRAVKIVRQSQHASAESFEREFKGLQKFEPISRSHEGLVDILSLGLLPDDAGFYYVMELADDAMAASFKSPVSSVPSERNLVSALKTENRELETYTPHTLRHELKTRGALPADEVISLGLKFTAALEHLHTNGLVHRDVKPSNILFVGGEPKLADAGLVAAMDDARSLVGTAGYIAPEGPGTPQADLYALGKVLYEAAFGRDRLDFPKLPRDMESRPDHRLVLELNEILIRACDVNPRKRYHNASELQAELELAHGGKSVRTRHLWGHCGRLFQLGMACALAASALWLGVDFFLSVSSKEEQRPKLSAIKAATDEYSEGRYFYSKNTGEALRKAIGRFERAIELDPNFAAAYGGLASCYSWEMPGFQTDLSKAGHYAEKALGLDEDLAEAHKVLAWIKFNEHDWRGGTKEAQRALKLAPNDPEVHSWYAVTLYWMGRTKESIAQLKRAQELDQTSLSIPALLGSQRNGAGLEK